MLNKFREAVSADRRRFKDSQFNLDLSYVTPRIIAMAIPSVGIQATYRNHMDDVDAFLRRDHGENFMIWNLTETSYDAKFSDKVIHLPFPDHHPPPLDLYLKIIEMMDNWLRADQNHVAVVHCKGGKGRTGTIISSLLFFRGECATIEEAEELFARMRSAKGKGVTQPSQRRYLQYFKTLMLSDRWINYQSIRLKTVTVSHLPVGKWFVIQVFNGVTDDARLLYSRTVEVQPNGTLGIPRASTVNLSEASNINNTSTQNEPLVNIAKYIIELDVRGDLYFKFLRCKEKDKLHSGFHVVLHTFFIASQTIVLQRSDLDHVKTSDKWFTNDLSVTFTFGPPESIARFTEGDPLHERMSTKYHEKQSTIPQIAKAQKKKRIRNQKLATGELHVSSPKSKSANSTKRTHRKQNPKGTSAKKSNQNDESTEIQQPSQNINAQSQLVVDHPLLRQSVKLSLSEIQSMKEHAAKSSGSRSPFTSVSGIPPSGLKFNNNSSENDNTGNSENQDSSTQPNSFGTFQDSSISLSTDQRQIDCDKDDRPRSMTIQDLRSQKLKKSSENLISHDEGETGNDKSMSIRSKPAIPPKPSHLKSQSAVPQTINRQGNSTGEALSIDDELPPSTPPPTPPSSIKERKVPPPVPKRPVIDIGPIVKTRDSHPLVLQNQLDSLPQAETLPTSTYSENSNMISVEDPTTKAATLGQFRKSRKDLKSIMPRSPLYQIGRSRANAHSSKSSSWVAGAPTSGHSPASYPRMTVRSPSQTQSLVHSDNNLTINSSENTSDSQELLLSEDNSISSQPDSQSLSPSTSTKTNQPQKWLSSTPKMSSPFASALQSPTSPKANDPSRTDGLDILSTSSEISNFSTLGEFDNLEISSTTSTSLTSGSDSDLDDTDDVDFEDDVVDSAILQLEHSKIRVIGQSKSLRSISYMPSQIPQEEEDEENYEEEEEDDESDDEIDEDEIDDIEFVIL